MRPRSLLTTVGAVSMLAVLLIAAKTYNPTPPAYTGPAVQPPAPRQLLVQAAFLGDSWTGGSDQGGNGPDNYSNIVAQRLGWYDLKFGKGGTGYLAGGGGDLTETFRNRAAAVGVDQPDIVFVVNGVNDLKPVAEIPATDTARLGAFYAQLEAAAEATFVELRHQAPQAVLVAIGYIPAGNSNVRIDRGNAQIRLAADRQHVTYWDASDWFAGDAKRYIGTDHFHPTDAGHRYLAGLIVARIRQAGLNKIKPAATG